MADIFISYDRDDKSKVEPIAKALEARGWSVWWDRSIPIGSTWADVIEEAINNTKCVVVAWSANSVSSRWVKNEAEEGASRDILIPVLVDRVTVPLAFRRIQTVDLVDWQFGLPHEGFAKLLDDVAMVIARPSAVADNDKTSKMQLPAQEQPSDDKLVQPVIAGPPKLAGEVGFADVFWFVISTLFGGLIVGATIVDLFGIYSQYPWLVPVLSVASYPLLGWLVVRVCGRVRKWANSGEVEDHDKERKQFLASVWPVTLILSLIYYPALWIVRRLF